MQNSSIFALSKYCIYSIASSLPQSFTGSFFFVQPSLLFHRFTFAPCLTHTPPWMAWFVQPSLLFYRFTFAPCLTHTPPWMTWFVHPSLLHRLTFAPCFTHTPPLTALFVHPLLLHRLTFAPCLVQTPPWMTWFISSRARSFLFGHIFSGPIFIQWWLSFTCCLCNTVALWTRYYFHSHHS